MPSDILASLIDHLRRPNPANWRLLGEGFSSTVHEYIPEAFVVRIARSDDSGRHMMRVANWMTWLQLQVPFSIPCPDWHLDPKIEPLLPFGVIGYQKLTGSTLQSETTTDGTIETLTGALIDLHSVPLPEPGFQPNGFPDRDHIRQHAQFDAIRPILIHHLSPAEWSRIDRWYRSPIPTATRQTIVHGDFWHENILIEPSTGRVTGIIDWDGVTIGDPAQDLVPLRYLGAEVAKSMVDGYLHSVDEERDDLELRLTWWWQNRDFEGIYLAMQMNDVDEIEDGIRKLRAGPILNP